jgi:predicted nucleic acid-binding protein
MHRWSCPEASSPPGAAGESTEGCTSVNGRNRCAAPDRRQRARRREAAGLGAKARGGGAAGWQSFLRYRDHALRFRDCTSFALMRRLRLTQVMALDADFRSLGLHCLPSGA